MESENSSIPSVSSSTTLKKTEAEEDLVIDKEVETIFIEKIPRTPARRFFEDDVPTFSEVRFLQHFRISRDLFHNLSTKYASSDLYEQISSQHSVLSPQKTLAVFLWFSGCEDETIEETYQDIKKWLNVSIKTIPQVIRQMIVFLSCMAKEAIRWPSLEEMKEEADYHKRLTKLPGVIGAIGCTRVEIPPPKENENDYLDRDGNTTVIALGVCNRHKKFINICIGCPGKVDEERVYNHSGISDTLISCPLDFYLVGDSKYPCKPHLLVPNRDNDRLTSAQKEFNQRLFSSRVQIEQAFESLKQRFPQLKSCKLKGRQTINHFIRACMVLHNLSKEEENCFLDEDWEDLDTDDDDDEEDVDVNSEENLGKSLRDSVCQYLTNLEN